LLAFSAMAACAARPAVEQPEENPAEQIMKEPAPAGFAYGKKGLQFTSADGNNVSVKAISASVNGRQAPQQSHWSPATACIRVSPAMAAARDTPERIIIDPTLLLTNRAGLPIN